MLKSCELFKKGTKMIDWDEVLEDVDWKKGLISLIVGIIVIGGGTFVALDYNRMSGLKVLLEADIQSITDFQQTWTASTENISDLESETKSLKSKIANSDVVLPYEVNMDDLEAQISALASESNVTIKQMARQNPTKDDEYLYLQENPVKLIFSGTPRRSAYFLQDVEKIDAPHLLVSDPMSDPANGKVIINFYSFDQTGWDEVHNCQIGITVPEIKTRDISGVMIFKNKISGLKNKADQQKSSLKGVKKEYLEICQAKMARDQAAIELEIINNKFK